MNPARAPGLSEVYDGECVDCPRLADFLAQVKQDYPHYHARPVAPFGAANARLLIVGLAPGMHGANRTGRPFTGDHAGILLYSSLHAFGFASGAESVSANDGLRLVDCRISNAVKCLPPQNKPLPAEIRRCNRYLAAELCGLRPRIVLALGSIAHQAVILALGLKPAGYRFAHHAVHALPSPTPGGAMTRLYDSYHCSRYNTQTRRLTPAMFHAVLADIARELRQP